MGITISIRIEANNIQLNKRYHMLTDILQDLLIRKRAMMTLPELAGISHTRAGPQRIDEVD